MTTQVIRYKTKPEAADENARLIEAVFTELHESGAENVRYAALRLDDGVTFVHVVDLEGGDNPLFSNAAFAAFTSGIAERCVEAPAPAPATVVGSYRFPL